MSYLVKFFNQLAETFEDRLPFFHNCSFKDGNYYADINQIVGQDCNVFHEKLVYLFLGKGRFMSEYKNGKLKYTPISFVIKPDADFKIDKIYPFDTGACSIGKYETILMKEDMEEVKEDFNLGDDIDIAYKLIAYFFKSLEDYIQDYPKVFDNKTIEDEAIKSGATGLEDINGVYGSIYISADGRKASVEVQVSGDLDLAGNSVYVLMPTKNFSENSNFIKFCDNNNVTPRFYADNEKLAADQYYPQMLTESKKVALEYLTKRN